jgi:hypothetical protein
MPRRVWVATALTWAASSLLLLAGPAYWAPASLLDWAAVLAYTAAWLLFAPAIVLASRIVPSRVSHIGAAVIAIAAVVTGVANLAADALQLDSASAWYVDGILAATILLVPLAYLFARDRSNGLAVFTLVLFLGIGLTAGGLGGLLVAAAFGALAYREDWFLPRRPGAGIHAVPAGAA